MFDIAAENPQQDDLSELLLEHLHFCHSVTPSESVFALDIAALTTPDITVYAVRNNGALVGVGALRVLDPSHGELKSMHTRSEFRGQGVARALVESIILSARAMGIKRLSLETGNHQPFDAARRLYSSLGFRECEVFGDYAPSPISVYMTRDI
jgi:putative acetyltransferase